MPENQVTKISAMRVRQGPLMVEPPNSASPAIEWKQPVPKHRAENFARNIAVSAALVVCAVVLRTGAVPPLDKTTDAVMAAATDQSLLDEQLGKLSFVSALFPETVLVFGESGTQLDLPISAGTVIHTWSEAEPYLSWRTNTQTVTASSDGEVIGVYHGNGDERLVQIMGDDGLSCLYGNLAAVKVQTGDTVSAGAVIGTLLPGEDFVFEVRREGRSINPTLYFSR